MPLVTVGTQSDQRRDWGQEGQKRGLQSNQGSGCRAGEDGRVKDSKRRDRQAKGYQGRERHGKPLDVFRWKNQ